MQPLRDLLGLVLVPAALFAVLLLPDHVRELPVERYEDGVTSLFLDRPYVNRAPAAALGGLRVVPIPRHLRFAVALELEAPARVWRLVCDRNEEAFLSGWEPVPDLALRVEGRSCVFTRAVARSLPAGVHRLAPGGPVSAAPILVETRGAVRATTTADWNKLTPAAGPIDVALRNPRKVGGLALLYAGWVWGYARWRGRAG
jgi:hypothetical protein